jgi:type IX secretion system PorP/SprF family membrane protein
MNLRLPFLVLVLLCIAGIAHAQQNLVYNHYFLNPFLYNPSYIAPNGYTELYLNYRKQWAGFGDNAPSTATLNFHLPINYKMGIGATAYQDQQGVLRTTTALLSYGYQIYFGKNTEKVHKLAFGISAGMTYSYIPLDKVENGDIPDNSLTRNNTSSMDGQVGFHYQLKNFRLSFALPRLFRSYVTSTDEFNQPTIKQVNSTISSISYNFAFSPRIAFEPIITYRTERDFDPQYEAAGVLKFNNIAWLGGSYRQDYGPAAFLGFNIKDRYKVGYAYEFAPSQISGIGGGSHEFQLVVRLGKKKQPRLAKKEEEQLPPVVAQDTTKVETLADKPIEDQEETKPTEQTKETSVAQEQQAQDSTPATPVTQEPAITASNGREEVARNTPEEESKKHGGETLIPGHYVVVGAFTSPVNARNYVNTLKRVGYPAGMSYYSGKQLYIVHMGNTATIEEARELRNQYRARSRYSFRDTWVLTIE